MIQIIKKNRDTLLVLSYIFYTIGSKAIKLTWTDKFKNTGTNLGYICVLILLLLLFLVFLCDLFCKDIRKYIYYSVPIMLSFVSAMVSGNAALMINLVYILMLSRVSFKKLLKYYLLSGVITLLFVFLLCQKGILSDLVVYFDYGVGHSYGLSHPNNLAGYMFALVACGWYLYGDDRPYIWFMVGLITSCISLAVMASRTIFISLLIMSLVIIAEPLFKKKNHFHLQIITIILLFASVSSSFILSYYNGTIFRLISGDRFFSNFLFRFMDSGRWVTEHGITFFGNKLPANAVFDLAYVRLFVEFGVVASVLHYLIVIKGIINCKGDYRLLLIICIFMLIGFMETSVYYIFYNPFLLLAFCEVDDDNGEVTSDLSGVSSIDA